ncbi:MAG: aminodeoxychorismate/anthranilate synthase component II [Planctomycetota bacterium]
MICLIDNYDSFVFNLARYFEELGEETVVLRNDVIDVAGIEDLAPDAIVLSPGPCGPEEAGIGLEVVRKLGPKIPILGVCLGHQTIAAAYGASVVRGRPVHGRSSKVQHTGSEIFHGVPSPMKAARYHSLVVSPENLPKELEVLATADDGRVVMAIRHRVHPTVGIQFHPESVLTDHGHHLLRNFLDQSGVVRSGVENGVARSRLRSA